MQSVDIDNLSIVAKELKPTLYEINEKYKDIFKIQILTLVPLHDKGACVDCDDSPVACYRCVMTVNNTKESPDDTDTP